MPMTPAQEDVYLRERKRLLLNAVARIDARLKVLSRTPFIDAKQVLEDMKRREDSKRVHAFVKTRKEKRDVERLDAQIYSDCKLVESFGGKL